MRRKITRVGFGAIALVCIAFFIIALTPTNAQQGNFNNQRLLGNYASQLTGIIDCPAWHPLAPFNGPYALNGRVSADGNGSAQGTVYDNLNGTLIGYSWEGTYEVNPDGTLLLDVYADFPGLGEIYVQMFGVLCENGKRVRLMHVGPTYDSNKVGTTITGSWIRQ